MDFNKNAINKKPDKFKAGLEQLAKAVESHLKAVDKAFYCRTRAAREGGILEAANELSSALSWAKRIIKGETK